MRRLYLPRKQRIIMRGETAEGRIPRMEGSGGVKGVKRIMNDVITEELGLALTDPLLHWEKKKKEKGRKGGVDAAEISAEGK